MVVILSPPGTSKHVTTEDTVVVQSTTDAAAVGMRLLQR